MDLYNLGPVNWIESQSLYHALAILDREGLIICYPNTPYVCLGLHDDLNHEIDQEYCQARDIPLLRRETGGGVVYLDERQLFYQLVLRRNNPLLPLRRTNLYKKFLQPARAVYQSLEMPVELKEPADLAVQGLKCSGNACGDIEGCTAYVGNMLIDFDFWTMSKVLRVPNETFRGFLYQSMRDHMTTLKDWGKNSVDHSHLTKCLIQEFEREFGALTPCRVDSELAETAWQVGNRLTSPDWLQMPGRRPEERRIKIAEGVYLLEKTVGSESRLVLLKDGVEEDLTNKESKQAMVM